MFVKSPFALLLFPCFKWQPIGQLDLCLSEFVLIPLVMWSFKWIVPLGNGLGFMSLSPLNLLFIRIEEESHHSTLTLLGH